MQHELPRPGPHLLGGKYVLGDRVGEGGMGVVHRGEDAGRGQTVAIKLLRRELVSEPSLAARFRAEAVAAARLHHANLAAVIDYGETDDGRPYLVMEYVPGRSLGAIVRAEGPLRLRRALALVDQIVAGLGAAHAGGVVHGDVKSDNVLVSGTPGLDERLKLIDFGLARMTCAEYRQATAAGAPLVSGTPEYMAPEVARGAAPTPVSDVYGLGIVLYELLTGRPPFYGGNATQIMTQQLEDAVVPPSLRCPERDLPRSLDAVVARALAKAPSQRYADVADLADALAHLGADSRPILTTAFDSAIPHPIGEEANTNLCRRLPRTTPADEYAPSRAETAARQRIGRAIAGGRLDDVADGYVELAALLLGRGHLVAAIHELEEGVDVLSGGAGPGDAGDAAAPVLAALWPLYDAIGDPRAAYAGAPDHWTTIPTALALP